MFVFCSFTFPVFRMMIVGLAGSPTETRQRQAEMAGYITWYLVYLLCQGQFIEAVFVYTLL